VSAPAPGRQRSLGASLLDQVLAETIDPAYAQAAAAKAAHASGSAGVARPGWLRRHLGQLLVALTLVIAGLLASVTYGEAAAGAEGREQTRQALRDDIGEASDTTDDLVAQLEELGAEVARTREQALAASTQGQQVLDELAGVELAAAVVAVTGPGLEVFMDNAPPAADSDPVGGSEDVAQPGIVQDGDLQLVVNGLWASGAEAISINGHRIGATTAIRQAGDAILVDQRPVTTPYVVSAIGDRQALRNAFLETPEANYLASLTRDYGVVFDFASADDLDLPAGTPAELRSARPLDPPAQDRSSEPGSGAGSGAPTPDPTTDGG
jgi:uncharacterized protein YlxW (UPF0749 family)